MLKDAVCQICTDVYDMERSVAAMPCGHTFHDECLIRWITNTRNCPTCRKPLKKNQAPIHKLFFSLDAATCSQRTTASPSSKDPAMLEANRKLKAQVTALQAAINKLKSECQGMEQQNVAMTCSLADKDTEIHTMKKVQSKLKEKIRDFMSREEETEKMKEKLNHLQHVQTIVDGVESEVRLMLEEKGGYTPQQLTYIVLLRQQLGNSKQTNGKLKRNLTELREKLMQKERIGFTATNENEMLKMELNQAEAKNKSLQRKCDTLIKAINSPRGVASSLASRFVHQSPAPEAITPLSAHPTVSNQSTETIDTSLDLFNESEQQDVKLALNFDEEDNQIAKKPKLISSKAMLTQDKRDVGDGSPASPHFAVPIRPKAAFKLKTKGRDQVKHKLKPLGSASSNLSNTHSSNNCNSNSSSNYFRQGFDGMGGQAHSFNRTKTAMQFNIFKKPAATKAKETVPKTASQTSINEFILIE